MSTKTEKIIKEWLNELPEPYRTQAMKYEQVYWDLKYPNQAKSLIEAFNWVESDEGFSYWNELFITL